MTIQVHLDMKSGRRIATTKEWCDFCGWVFSLKPQERYTELVHLCRFSWNEPVAYVINQLRDALEHNPKDDPIRETAKRLLTYMESRNTSRVIVISDKHGLVTWLSSAQSGPAEFAADRSVKIIPDGHKEALPAVPVRVELSDADKLRSNWDDDMPADYKGLLDAEVTKQKDFSG